MKGKRLKSFSGTVLIMVLTVMLVLIIMLMATLTVVSTASQRIYTKYEENQAYYSARSALDVFTQNMLYDKAYYAYDDSGAIKTFTYGDGDSANIKQGLAMQLDLYKIKTKDTADADVTKSMQNLLQTEFTDYINTGVTGKDEYKANFGVSKNAAGKYESVIIYEVEYPKVIGQEGSGASHDYGKLADDRKAKITIEVLSREYDMGDDVLTSDATTKVKDKIASFNGDQTQIATFLNTPQNYDDVIKAVVNGSRKKDKIKVKITATTKVMGVEGTAVLICNSNEPPVNNSSRAITAFGGTSSDNLNVLGGMSSERTITWGTNDGFIYGPVYVEEDFSMQPYNGPKVYLSEGENLVVMGNMSLSNSGHFEVHNMTSPLLTDDTKAPVVYVGGNLNITGGASNPFQNVDVVAKTLNVKGMSEASVTLDSSSKIYCENFISDTQGSNSTYNGDIYVDGDVTIFNDNDTKILYAKDGDGHDILTSPLNAVHGGIGTIYYTGNVKDGATGLDVPDPTSGFSRTTSFWSNVPTVADLTNNNPTLTEGQDGKKVEFQLPGRSAKKQLETHVQSFDDYYVKDENGNRNMINVTITKDDGSTETVVKPEVKSPQIMADIDTMTDKTKPFTITDTGITDLLTNKAGAGGNYYGEYFNRVLDTGGGEVKCQWNVDNEKIYIKGGGTVVLLLSKAGWGGGISYSNNNLILVDDDTTLKILGDTTSGDIWFMSLEVYNQTTWGAYKSHDAGAGINALKVGNAAGKGIKVPKIYYYFSGSGKVETQNNTVLTGYIYGPDVNLEFPAGSTGMPAQGMQYNGASVTSSAPVSVIGSALVNRAKIRNNSGVAYINPNLADDGDAGDPIHQWQANLYTRN